MPERKYLSATSLAGTSTTRQRVENDFYATPFYATEAIIHKEALIGNILEPAAGQGHISKVIRDWYPRSEIVSTDLVDRGDPFNMGIIPNIDFLTYDFGRKFDNVITNPPFSLAKEFVERALSLAERKVIMFAKIQLLEGTARRELFENNPPKAVYVFSKRVSPLNNGKETDEEGKPWASTMCFAWFVWDKDYHGEPIIRWL